MFLSARYMCKLNPVQEKLVKDREDELAKRQEIAACGVSCAAFKLPRRPIWMPWWHANKQRCVRRPQSLRSTERRLLLMRQVRSGSALSFVLSSLAAAAPAAEVTTACEADAARRAAMDKAGRSHVNVLRDCPACMLLWAGKGDGGCAKGSPRGGSNEEGGRGDDHAGLCDVSEFESG